MTDHARDQRVEMLGGAGPREAAAIVAAVVQVLAEMEDDPTPAPPPARRPWLTARRTDSARRTEAERRLSWVAASGEERPGEGA